MARKATSAVDSVDTREKLLHAAARAFGKDGYSATTMRAIADQADIEAASIYYHFKSKEDLVDQVMEIGAVRIVHQLELAIGGLAPGADAESRFRAAVLGQLRGLVQHGDFALANSRLLGQLPDEARKRQDARRERHQIRWNGILKDLQSEGKIRKDIDLHLARIFILGSINTVQIWFDAKRGSLEQIADRMCDLFLNGAVPR